MNKFGNCPLCGKQVKPTNLRKIARQNQLYGFRMALEEDMTPDEFANYIVAKSGECEKQLREMWT